MMISRRNFLAVAGAAAAAAALTACGGSSSSTASSAAASTSTAASTAEGGEKIVKVALTCDTGTIDDESFNQACWTAVYKSLDCFHDLRIFPLITTGMCGITVTNIDNYINVI